MITYDFIVVGAGTVGCAIDGQLAAQKPRPVRSLVWIPVQAPGSEGCAWSDVAPTVNQSEKGVSPAQSTAPGLFNDAA